MGNTQRVDVEQVYAATEQAAEILGERVTNGELLDQLSARINLAISLDGICRIYDPNGRLDNSLRAVLIAEGEKSVPPYQVEFVHPEAEAETA